MNIKNNQQEIYFNFSYFALRLLGRGLYSNAWTAISELVANGFDAEAQHVKVYINAINKEKSVIEIFDDGYGMGYNDLVNKYTLIGKNKRDDDSLDEVTKQQLMGRKGIGKLAALYLSKKYYLISKTQKEISAWCLNAFGAKDSEIPKLEKQDIYSIEIEAKEYWDSFKTGTMIKLTDVDLQNFGVQSLKGLKARLADFFLLDSLAGKIEVAFLTYRGEKIVFEEVKKDIAFKNMCAFFNNTTYDYKQELRDTITFRSKIESVAKKARQVVFFEPQRFDNTSGERCFLLETGVKTKNGIPYSMTGWVGIHATIEKEWANKNDSRYLKNKVYNPNKLRLYVRKKLAVENFLEYLHNTQAFSNYIEGEISFDVLDDDKLPDIATSNRQGFDEESDRVKLLVEIIKPIVNALITQRVRFGDDVKQEEDSYHEEQERSAKENEAIAYKMVERAEQEKTKAETKAKTFEENLISEQKRNNFLMDTLSPEQKDFANRLHLVKINLNTIDCNIENLILKNRKKSLTIDTLWDGIRNISYCTKRINALFSYALRANFDTEIEVIKADLFDFISEYCNTILKKDYPRIAFLINNTHSIVCEKSFSPQDIGVILENVANNSRKAYAKTITVNLYDDNKNFIIDLIDDGNGINKNIIDINSLFEFGKSFTETGSGVGLYHIKEIVKNKLKGEITIDSEYSKGFKLQIRIGK